MRIYVMTQQPLKPLISFSSVGHHLLRELWELDFSFIYRRGMLLPLCSEPLTYFH